MQLHQLDNDITVYCVTAKSFPAGIIEAHETLHALLSQDVRRRFFGISSGLKGGGIIYKAAAEEVTTGELKKHGLEEFVIKKGAYLSETIPHFQNNIPAIGQTFQKMLTDLRIDPNGACIEIYYSDQKDLQCLVKLE